MRRWRWTAIGSIFVSMVAIVLLFAQTRIAAPVTDSVRLLAEVRSREAVYIQRWRGEYRTAARPRVALRWGGCDWQKRIEFDLDQHQVDARLIRNAADLRASLCPHWITGGPEIIGDESIRYDDLLTAKGHAAMRGVRRPLIAFVDSVSRQFPGDEWLAGERIRLRVEQDDGSASLATRDCRSAAWWCAALTGYAEHIAGDDVAADSAFNAAVQVMPDSIRCEWNDLGPLFTMGQRNRYGRTPCELRDSLNANVWWLADPLFLVPGNERRAEHYSRHVHRRLRMATRVREPLDAAAAPFEQIPFGEMVIRYGWPRAVATPKPNPRKPSPGGSCGPGVRVVAPPMGSRGDRGPLNSSPRIPFSRICADTALPQWSHSVAGYRMLMGHTVSNLDGVTQPLGATDSVWDLMPEPDWSGRGFDDSWWAPEFYAPRAGPLAVMESQVAFFRRDTTALAMVAVEWDSTRSGIKQPARGMFGLVTSTGPEDRAVGATSRVVNRLIPALIAPVRSEPMILAAELIGTDSAGRMIGPSGRTRFGITPPLPLASEPLRGLWLSDIVLLRPDVDAQPRTLTDIHERMLGSTHLRDSSRFAVAFELYGAAVGDSAEYALRVRRHATVGTIGRVLSLGLKNPPSDSVTTKWSERIRDEPLDPRARTSVRLRTVGFDASALPAGEYSLQITATCRSRGTAVSERRFTIVK